MTFAPSRQPAIVLVDDDFHSTRLMVRMLNAHGGPQVETIGDAGMALEALTQRAALCPAGEQPMVIVDLKASSCATAEFIADLRLAAPGLLVVAMSPSLDRLCRDKLLDAGAAAVFERHADLNLYRREAASIVAYWVRGQRLNAVGT
jgi:CheY-like chemotaxis protein